MMKLPHIILTLFIALLTPSSYAKSLDESLLVEISQSKEWNRLLHFRGTLFSKKKSSFSKTQDFFIHDNGAINSTDELIATINLFKKDIKSRCRYPARYIFLNKYLPQDLPFTDLQSECKTLNEWLKGNRVKSLSLLFATGYFSNPASYYGHTLLKFNSEGDDELLDTSLNYGAKIPLNENPIIYIIKGLFGGYDARFTYADYYHHNMTYGEIDLRDTWEYKLSLTQYQVDLIVYHAFEVLNQEFTYFFSNRNCVYNLAEILELAIDENLTHDNSLASIPVRLLFDLENNDTLVAEKKLHLSRRSRFINKYNNLEDSSQLKNLIEKGVVEFFHKNKSLNSDQKIALVDTYIDYLRFLEIADKENFNTLSMRDALSYRMKLLGAPYNPKVTSALPPTFGQKPSMLRLHWSNQKAALQYRLAYYDYLAPDIDHPPFSQLKMGNIKISKATHGNLNIDQLDVLHIENLNPGATGLKGDAKQSWMFRLAYEDSNFKPIYYHKSFLVEGGYGKAAFLTNNTVIFTMAQLRAQLSDFHYSDVFLGARAGLVIKPKFLKTSIIFNHLSNISSDRKKTYNIELKTVLFKKNDWDIRYTLNKENYSDLSHALSVGKYW